MIELAFMTGQSRTSGGSTTLARRLTGIIGAITTNATARNSGSSLGEVIFNDIMTLIWAGTGEVATEVYVGSTLKRDISGFTAGSTKFTDTSGDRRLFNAWSVYESDFGEMLMNAKVKLSYMLESLKAFITGYNSFSYGTL
jgi:hypothetical protein